VSDKNSTFYLVLVWVVISVIWPYFRKWLIKKRQEALPRSPTWPVEPASPSPGPKEVILSELDLDSPDDGTVQLPADEISLLDLRISEIETASDQARDQASRNPLLLPLVPVYDVHVRSPLMELRSDFIRLTSEANLTRDEQELLLARIEECRGLQNAFTSLWKNRLNPSFRNMIAESEVLLAALVDTLELRRLRGPDGTPMERLVPVPSPVWEEETFHSYAQGIGVIYVPANPSPGPAEWPLLAWSLGHALWDLAPGLQEEVRDQKAAIVSLNERLLSSRSLSDMVSTDFLLGRWLKTLWVDAFAVAATGPAGARALLQHLAKASGDSTATDRPPAALRVASAVRVLEHLGNAEEAAALGAMEVKYMKHSPHLLLPILDGSLARFRFDPMADLCGVLEIGLLDTPLSMLGWAPISSWRGLVGSQAQAEALQLLSQDLERRDPGRKNALLLIAAAATASFQNRSKNAKIRSRILSLLRGTDVPPPSRRRRERCTFGEVLQSPRLLRDVVMLEAILSRPRRTLFP